MNRINFLFLGLLVFVSTAWGLEPYQGQDHKVESWKCGAPLVEALRVSDPNNLLQDSRGRLDLKASLERISEANMKKLKDELLPLSDKEEALITLIKNRHTAPIVHRTSLDSSKIILQNNGMVSATKRNAPAKVTPDIEQSLFSGWDCIFTTVGPQYGTEDYGTTIFNFKHKKGFAWGSIYTGFTWVREVANRDQNAPATPEMRQEFAKQVFTNNHWEEALALHIIQHVRRGSTLRSKGQPYNRLTILDELLQINTRNNFWKKVTTHRLAYLEGHYTDNVGIDTFQFVQFRTMDQPSVITWGFPAQWFTGTPEPFIQYFNRPL